MIVDMTTVARLLLITNGKPHLAFLIFILTFDLIITLNHHCILPSAYLMLCPVIKYVRVLIGHVTNRTLQ